MNMTEGYLLDQPALSVLAPTPELTLTSIFHTKGGFLLKKLAILVCTPGRLPLRNSSASVLT